MQRKRRRVLMMICRLVLVTSQGYKVLELGGSLRHTLDLSFAPGRPRSGRPGAKLRSRVCLRLPPSSRTLYPCDATRTSRHITIKLFSVGCFHFSYFLFVLFFGFHFYFLFVMSYFVLLLVSLGAPNS